MMSPPRSGGGSVLPLANRIVRLGGAGAGAVLLVLCAVVAQATQAPRGRPAAAPEPASQRTRPAHASRGSRPAETTAKTTPLVRTIRAAVLRQRSTIARREFGGRAPQAPTVLLSRSDAAKGWAFGSSVIAPPDGVDAPPDASLFIARHLKTGWQVSVTGAPTFAAFAKHAPSDVVPDGERVLLARYGKAAASGAATGLELPWGPGKSWTMRPAGDPRAIAFAGGDGRVLAPGPGRLYRLCGRTSEHAMLLLIHPNGLASTFSRLTALTAVEDGGAVRTGTYLGTTGRGLPCSTGQAPGPASVVFGVLSGGRPAALDGLRIGGWTLQVAASGRAVAATRSGVRVEQGDPLLNLGDGVVPTPAPSPTLTSSPATSPTTVASS
ncbi:hypothetical protein [Actinomadura nitritigenes]|uniref:M23 family metallopeptidase n=1 Tax=Actinomadura nitritigenes TaxID=134602 RepID=A0ABS3QTN1_9ACTN|nr:hypothetical protein [Actinomadura nitritigenes]MBO2437324.1 hypothetical protein [Actinomadura nitritigenes]